MNSKKENEFNILKFLYQVGEIRTSDFNLYLLSLYNQNSAVTRTVRRLIKEALIEKQTLTIKPTDNNKKGLDQIYLLTQKGKLKYLEQESDDYYKKLRPLLPRQTSGSESDKTNKLLTDIGIMALFRACNVPVFPHEKPSLLYLRDTLVGSKSTANPAYQDKIDKDLCKAGLISGIFYTTTEYLDYIKIASPSRYDTVLGTRIRGIFISYTSCFAVYTSEKYANRILKVNLKGENGLLDSLETIRSFTNVYRPLPTFDEIGLLENGKTYIKERAANKPYALIISDGESLAYATATGYSRGKHHVKNISKATIGIENAFEETQRKVLSKQTTFLTAASNLYDKIYVIPSDTNGYFELNFLLSNNLESWKVIGEGILEKEKQVFKKDSEIVGDFPYACLINGNRIPVSFFPVFEAKRLYKIATSKENPIIVTNQHLLNMIAHSIGKDGRYYDYESMHVFSKNAAFIYDSAGYIKGKRLLEEYLQENGQAFKDNTEPHDLPKRFSLSSESFYNKIARGELDLSVVAERVITKPYIPVTKRRRKSVIMNISLNPDLAKEVKLAAASENISISRFVANCLKKHIS